MAVCFTLAKHANQRFRSTVLHFPSPFSVGLKNSGLGGRAGCSQQLKQRIVSCERKEPVTIGRIRVSLNHQVASCNFLKRAIEREKGDHMRLHLSMHMALGGAAVSGFIVLWRSEGVGIVGR